MQTTTPIYRNTQRDPILLLSPKLKYKKGVLQTQSISNAIVDEIMEFNTQFADRLCSFHVEQIRVNRMRDIVVFSFIRFAPRCVCVYLKR